jgi:hypothetical protein
MNKAPKSTHKIAPKSYKKICDRTEPKLGQNLALHQANMLF